MKTASNNLISLLSSGRFFRIAEVYTITLIDGTVMRYTSVDKDIAWNNATHLSKGLLLSRGTITESIGLEAGDLEITAVPTTANIGNVGFMAAVVNGALDFANVRLERLYFSDWSANAVGGITKFSGNVSDIDEMGRSKCTIHVKDVREQLNIQWPLSVYQAACPWRVYGSGCGLNRTTWTANGTVSGNNSNTVLIVTGLNAANNYYDQGVIAFNSGNASGARRTIKSYAAGNVTVILPLPAVPGNGSTFSIYPGCDHSRNTCANKFSNSNNYRGMPYIPVPETAL